MKKLLFLAILCLSVFSYAQNNDEEDINLNEINDRKHELRLDALEGLAVPAIDISYEYVLSKYSGFGASINFNLGDDNDIDQKFSFTPYYRQYFFNKKDFGARGFFVEGSLQYGSGETEDYIAEIDQFATEDWSQFGIGFALGQKWVSRNGFVIELLFGGGRYFGSNDYAPEGFFRGGVNIGYRF